MDEKSIGQHGIQETKDVVAFGVDLGLGIKKSIDEGISWQSALNFGDAAKEAPAAIMGISEVPAELMDVDSAEAAQLINLVQSKVPGADGVKAILIAQKAAAAGVALKELIEVCV